MTLGNTRHDAHALVDTPADTLAEVEAVTLADTRGDAQALIDTLADTLAEVEAVTLADTRNDAQALVDTLADTLPRWRLIHQRTDGAMRTHRSTLRLTRLQSWRR